MSARVIRYRTKPECADENQQLVERVFAEARRDGGDRVLLRHLPPRRRCLVRPRRRGGRRGPTRRCPSPPYPPSRPFRLASRSAARSSRSRPAPVRRRPPHAAGRHRLTAARACVGRALRSHIVDGVHYLPAQECTMPELVDRVRAFNRGWTEVLGLLDEGLLATEHTLAEARVIFELRPAPVVGAPRAAAPAGDGCQLPDPRADPSRGEGPRRVDAVADRRAGARRRADRRRAGGLRRAGRPLGGADHRARVGAVRRAARERWRRR